MDIFQNVEQDEELIVYYSKNDYIPMFHFMTGNFEIYKNEILYRFRKHRMTSWKEKRINNYSSIFGESFFNNFTYKSKFYKVYFIIENKKENFRQKIINIPFNISDEKGRPLVLFAINKNEVKKHTPELSTKFNTSNIEKKSMKLYITNKVFYNKKYKRFFQKIFEYIEKHNFGDIDIEIISQKKIINKFYSPIINFNFKSIEESMEYLSTINKKYFKNE